MEKLFKRKKKMEILAFEHKGIDGQGKTYRVVPGVAEGTKAFLFTGEHTFIKVANKPEWALDLFTSGKVAYQGSKVIITERPYDILQPRQYVVLEPDGHLAFLDEDLFDRIYQEEN